jgi:hypothetical protein
MRWRCGNSRTQERAAIDAHFGYPVFKLLLRGLARNAFHLDAAPSEIAFARFGSEAAPRGRTFARLPLASSSSSESPDVTMSERTRCGGHALLYPDNPDGALEAVKVGWGLGAAVCIWTGRAGSPSNSIRSRPQAGIKSDRGRLHRLGRGRRSSERCSHLLVALGSGVLGACAAPVLRHRRY